MIPEWAVKLDLRTPEIQAAVQLSMVETLHQGTAVMEADAKARCPVGDPPKHLRDAIRSEVDEEKMIGRVIVGGKLGKYSGAHAYMVEFGTAPHEIKVGEEKRTLAIPASQVILGRTVHHPGTAAQPFMRPSFDENAGKVSDFYRRHWDRNVGRVVLQ
jgi:HK97 gp10 family phage protein